MSNRLSTEELAEAWENDKDSEYIQIADDNSVRYIAHGKVMEEIAPAGCEDAFEPIRTWMDKAKFWPNIWSVNDHGNVTLHDACGNDLGGIV